MEIFKKLKNNQRGSITVFVLATMLIVVGIIVTIYMTTINKNNTQIAQLNKIQEEYMQTTDNSAMDQAYDENIEFGPGMIADKNEEYEDDDGDTATIPKGFEIVPGLDDVSEGLVISDNPEDTEKEGETPVAKGNQFVWIPVETPVASSEENGTSNKAMAVKQGNNYRGLLYNFTSDGSTVIEGCTTNEFDYREPAYLKDSSHTDESLYNEDENGNKIVTEKSLQEEYNKMIESVNKYHGFYVGRYELGLEETEGTKETKPVVKNASTNTGIKTADASNPNTSMWYGLYSKCKEFAPEESEKSVVSSMIWGSQYDAMMNWMQGLGESVTTSVSFSSYITGENKEDEIKNVFDLNACHREWTLEAYSTGSRGVHGGYSNDGIYPSYRVYESPSSDGNYNSTRITLYIK